MAKKNKNLEFNLGLNRMGLIEAAVMAGKGEKQARKASTKTLENYVLRSMVGGKGKLPTIPKEEQKTIAGFVQDYGLVDGLKRLNYKATQISGESNDRNFLRLTMRENFAIYYDGVITNDMITEIISKLPDLEETKVGSDEIKISQYYHRLYKDYAAELKAKEKAEQEALEKAEQERNKNS